MVIVIFMVYYYNLILILILILTPNPNPRTVHQCKATPLGGHTFKLELTTQAGTYIKEFVHGDFGRTSPNLKELLHADCDITALDVEVCVGVCMSLCGCVVCGYVCYAAC